MTGTATAPDHSATAPAPRWPLLVVVWLLLPLAIVGAGAMSGYATLALAARHGVPVEVRPFLLGMVEVVSLSGTLGAIFATGSRLQTRAMVAVVASSTVALVAGWQAAGWVGALAAPFLVYLVHLAAEAWAELRMAPTAPATTLDHPLTSDDAPEPPVSEEMVEASEPIPDQPATVELGPVHGPLTLVEYLRELDELPSERELARDLSTDHTRVSRHAARMILLEVRPGLRAVSA